MHIGRTLNASYKMESSGSSGSFKELNEVKFEKGPGYMDNLDVEAHLACTVTKLLPMQSSS